IIVVVRLQVNNLPTLSCLCVGIAPSLETPDYNKYETLRGLTALSQEWMKFHKLFKVDQIRFHNNCRHLFCDPHLVAHQPADPQTLAVAWTNNAAHNWSEDEVSGWLKTHIGLAGFEPLIRVNQISGDVLPSLLLRQQRHAFEIPIPVDSLDVLERAITELILLGPPSRLSLRLPLTVMSVSVVIILYMCWMVVHCYLFSRHVRQKRLSWLDLQRTRLAELRDRMSSLESEMPDFALNPTPTKTPKLSDGYSGDRRSSSVSRANSGAVTVMQQILDVTVRQERSYFERLLEFTGTLLLEIENQLYDHHSWVPFAVDLSDLNHLMESFDLSSDAPEKPELSPHVSEMEVTGFSDENEPRHYSHSSDASTHELKIPKPSRIPYHTLTPSFHLMNPPACLQRNQLGVTTPSHIPLGPLKLLNNQPSMEATKRLPDLGGACSFR
ncbi:hypothetical protein AHF37_03243, partial [Paragonimus kellicotti]